MKRRNVWIVWWGAVAVALGVTACGQQERAVSPSIQEKTFSLAPATAPLNGSFLTGELKDLRVVKRVEEGTGKVVDAPKLRATLRLKNSSRDQTARLLGGRIEYADGGGKPIALAEGESDTSFKFYAYSTERLDPGMEISQDIDVPFPAAALENRQLRDLRVELSYIPTQYRKETLAVPVSLAPSEDKK